MKTLITGISSQVGRSLSEYLITLGHEVVGFDIVRSEDIPAEVAYVEGDVRDFSTLIDIAQGCDRGIHLAVRATDNARARDIFDVNASGAYGFMAAASENGFRNAILASSAPVHLTADRSDNVCLPRTSEDADHAYDLSKVLQEVIFRDFHSHGIPAMCLRFGHIVWGERAVNLDEPIPLAGFDYCRGGWVALEDVVTACASALDISPDRHTFEICNIIGSQSARERLNVEAVEQRLDFKFAYDFADYE